MLRARKKKREVPIADEAGGTTSAHDGGLDPGHQAMMAEALSVAVFVVLEKLNPAERVSFVLHDMFDVSFDEISAIVGRSPAAVRQPASRARRRVQRADVGAERDHTDRRTAIAAFSGAARAGDVETLLSVLAPDVVLRGDAAAVQMGAPAEVRGPGAVADVFKGRAQVARLAELDGNIGAVWAPGGAARVAFLFSIRGQSITGIDLIAKRRPSAATLDCGSRRMTTTDSSVTGRRFLFALGLWLLAAAVMGQRRCSRHAASAWPTARRSSSPRSIRCSSPR